jgi:rare lipoprotein A
VVLSLAAVSSAAQHTSRSAARRAAPAPRLVQIGLASFYGAGFQGDRTASGERFDQRQLVAAHRNLPLGSVVRVTNLENGRSIVVRVIDRGPYGRNHRKGCIIDLSKAAARQLGFVGDGVTRVKVRVLHLASDHKEH